MASTTVKPTTPAAAARRKSTKGSGIVTLKLSPDLLKRFAPAAPVKVEPPKEESPSKDSSSTISNTQPIPVSSNGDNPTESTSNTPVANGTPAPSSSMPPPTEGPKKKGVKRSSGAAFDANGTPKPRGKPGPKKKARLEDGTIDHSTTTPRATTTAAHKLGPKANQGAINAGLRALDRTGKPCRKWQKGGFKLKSFTGVVWEIPRWKAPPKITIEGVAESSTTSGESSKENKDNSQLESEKSEKSNTGVDVGMANNLVSSPAPSLPAPVATESATPTVMASA